MDDYKSEWIVTVKETRHEFPLVAVFDDANKAFDYVNSLRDNLQENQHVTFEHRRTRVDK